MKYRVYKTVAVAFVLAAASTAFVASGSAATRPDPYLSRTVEPNPFQSTSVKPDPFLKRGVRPDPFRLRGVRDAF